MPVRDKGEAVEEVYDESYRGEQCDEGSAAEEVYDEGHAGEEVYDESYWGERLFEPNNLNFKGSRLPCFKHYSLTF